jgi:glutamine amidotransferase
VIAVIDYYAGNLTSVKLALDGLCDDVCVTNRAEDILSAERIVFPGVGAAGAAMARLADMGLLPSIRRAAEEKPFLGICLGTQIILERSEEDGGVACMGLLPGAVEPFTPSPPRIKVPQMGWNSVRQVRPHPLFEGIDDESEFYFVHSYYPCPAQGESVLGETEYAGVTFASVIGKGNIVATQFHPEKSGRIGQRLLANFTKWDGQC